MRLRLRFATFRYCLGSVRVRLTLWYLAILALIFLVFGAILSGVAVHQTQVTNQETLHSISQQLASTLGADGTLHHVLADCGARVLIASAGMQASGGVTADLQAGEVWALVCQFADSAGAPEHIALGMMKVMTVTGAP